MFQWPCYLLDKVPHVAHSCNQSSMVALMLTFRRPGTITQFSNHLIYLKYIYSFGHCGHLVTAVQVQCFPSYQVTSSAPCQQLASNLVTCEHRSTVWWGEYLDLKKEGLSYIIRSCKVCIPRQMCNYVEQMKVDGTDRECTTNTWQRI
jgi:hypothetical protein